MTEKQIQAMFVKWQSRLGLQNWRFSIEFVDGSVEHKGQSCHMKVHRSDHYDRAAIQVSRSALDPNELPDSIEKDLIKQGAIDHEEFTEISVVHELLHLALREVMIAADLIREDVHPTARKPWDEAFIHAEEQTVERLAMALVTNWA